LYYCCSQILSLNLGFRFDTRPRPKPRVPSLAPLLSGAGSFCAGLRLSKNSRLPSPFFRAPLSGKAGAKVLLFSEPASTFFKYFSS
jgi:hypothetical protein